jgi:hypothetical protein
MVGASGIAIFSAQRPVRLLGSAILMGRRAVGGVLGLDGRDVMRR